MPLHPSLSVSSRQLRYVDARRLRARQANRRNTWRNVGKLVLRVFRRPYHLHVLVVPLGAALLAGFVFGHQARLGQFSEYFPAFFHPASSQSGSAAVHPAALPGGVDAQLQLKFSDSLSLSFLSQP